MGDYINNFLDPLTGYTGLPRIDNSVSVTTAVTNTGSSATDLMSYTLPGMSALYSQGGLASGTNGVRIVACGIFAANGNTKTITLQFGGTTLATINGAINDGSWRIDAFVFRITSSTQTANALVLYGSTSPLTSTMTTTSPTIDTTASVEIKCVGTGSSTADITQNFLSVVSC